MLQSTGNPADSSTYPNADESALAVALRRLNAILTERQEIQSLLEHKPFVETRLLEFLNAEPPTFRSISVL